jgi:tetraacyldisaccharide 4'-kinase
LAVLLRKLLFSLGILKSQHPGIPVIVVGNITAGGSGKTPLVLWVAEFLKDKGWSPGIISRGYGAQVEAPRAATLASNASEVGDEPILLARRSGCPVWVGPDRVEVARALRAQHPEVDVLILDDGLQHYRLRRDVEIAVVDDLGNGFLQPAGPLREPASRLRSVDAVVSHGSNTAGSNGGGGFKMRLEGAVLRRMIDAGDQRPATAFAGQTLHAVAGIGNPGRFFRHLEKLGLKIFPHPFPDHHAFVPADLDFAAHSHPQAPVVMTEKDAVKLRHAAQPGWWVLPVAARPDPAFGDWLLGKMASLRSAANE